MKVEIGPRNCLYPMPTALVGANVKGEPNYLAVAHVGIMEYTTVSLSMNKIHYTNLGIKENGTFGVNIPSIKMVEKTDYCGLVSGKTTPKAPLFKTFYGKLQTAPMIEECPLNMECKLVKTVDFPNNDVFIGQISASYADKEVLKDDIVDIGLVQPLLFVMHDRCYWKIGGKLANAWEVGKKLKKTTKEK
jgi:flavin reductase (DIM6/NTAB) family NADH-FMN oxidoreductase RutF